MLMVSSADETLNSWTNSSYSLSVSVDAAHAIVRAPTIYGAIYGMETFSQLAEPGSCVINASSVLINDWPSYHHRSFMADTGRRKCIGTASYTSHPHHNCYLRD